LFAFQAWSSNAAAHIKLLEPASWIVENGTGDPQKTDPCGGPGTATNMITTYEAGQEITVHWQETVFHPGHFRIAFSANRADFVEPEVQLHAGGNISESATIMDPVAAPVLVDGLFPRTSNSMGSDFSTTIKLPEETCEKCTLQVMQFMAEHAPGYFYHHCADIKIVEKGSLGSGTGGTSGEGTGGSDAVGAAGTASTGQAGASMSMGGGGSGGSSSMPAGSGGGSDDEDDDDGGCSITSGAPAHASQGVLSFALLGLGAALLRHRRARG
jgi:MYXO-CTERM domain-containing protein